MVVLAVTALLVVAVLVLAAMAPAVQVVLGAPVVTEVTVVTVAMVLFLLTGLLEEVLVQGLQVAPEAPAVMVTAATVLVLAAKAAPARGR